MSAKLKNRFIFTFLCVLVGSFISALIWSFLKLMSVSIEFVWEFIPTTFNIPFYTFIVCIIGALLIGLLQKKFGEYPEELETVMAKVKRDGKYPYNNIPIVLVMAILPLIFGGSVGPEAGLTGVIVGLCYWAGDKFKYSGQRLYDLTQIGVSATLGVLFSSPFFGFLMPIENSDDENSTTFPKKYKLFTYFVAIGSGSLIFYLLTHYFGAAMIMPHFGQLTFVTSDLFYIIPLILCGALLGMLFHIFKKISHIITKPLKKYPVIKALIGGVLLATCGVLLPLTMFSGEHEITILMNNYKNYTPYILILIAIVKIFITNICLHTGFRGGHFFPSIFAGVSLGYALSLLFPVSQIFCIAVVTAATLGIMMKKPLCVALLLLICFSLNSIVFLIIAAFLSSLIPIPKFLSTKTADEK